MGAGHPMPPIDEHTATVVAQYNLEASDVAKLFYKFNEYDEHRQGFWTIVEFNKYLRNAPEDLPTPCLESFIGLASSTRDGRMSFTDFLISCTSYCALSREELLQFFYIIMDRDRSGILDKDEIFGHFSATVKMQASTFGPKGVYKQDIYPPNYLEALRQFKNGKWSGLMFEEFCWLCDLFPHVGFPVALLQDKMRERILGASFWHSWDDERLKIFHLEAESKSIQFETRSILTGQPISITKPGRVSMKEVFEFTKRNGLKRVQYDKVEGVWKSVERTNFSRPDWSGDVSGTTSYTKGRDQVLSRAPLLNLIRNPNSVYYVPLDGSRPVFSNARVNDDAGIVNSTIDTKFARGETARVGFLGALDESKGNPDVAGIYL